MRTLPRIAATAVATTALLMSTGATAHAQAVTVKDKSSDVVAYTSDDTDTGTVLGYQDSLDSGADVRSMKVKHTKKSISITLKAAELDRGAGITVMFKVPGKSQPQWILASMSRTKAVVFNANDTAMPEKVCNVPLTVKTGTKGSIKAVVKRSCLKSPKKIKVAAVMSTVEITGDTTSYKADVVSATSVRTPTFTKWLKAS